MLPYRKPYRALIQSFRCDVLSEMGQFTKVEAGLEQMADTFRATRESWIPFFTSWCEAVLASYSGDRDRTVRAVLTCEQNQETISDPVSRSEFLAQAADLLDRVGEPTMGSDVWSWRVSEPGASSAPSRSSKPSWPDVPASRHAIRLSTEVLDRPDLEPQERWPVLLTRARAAQRAGDERAAAWGAEAFDTAASLGHPEGPMVRDRDVAQALLPLAAGASQAASLLLHGVGQVSVSLFGRFDVSKGGRSVHLPPGRPAKAVRAVATSGGWIHAEELQEILWPESEAAAARNRMRKVRAGSVVRPAIFSFGTVTRRAGGRHDMRRRGVRGPRTEGTDALAAGDPSGAAAWARSALTHCKGDLLPEDRYEAWAEKPRRAAQLGAPGARRHVAREAEDRSDIDEAIRQVERAIEIQRYDEVRYIRLATLLASQGRVGSARETLHRARVVLDELNLDPSSSLEQLESTLGAAPGAG